MYFEINVGSDEPTVKFMVRRVVRPAVVCHVCIGAKRLRYLLDSCSVVPILLFNTMQMSRVSVIYRL